jgi:predicted DsbA family dithiol-disulfide isomerase
MDEDAFKTALDSEEIEKEFRRLVWVARRLGVRSFPSLVLKTDEGISLVTLDYQDYRVSLKEVLENAQYGLS